MRTVKEINIEKRHGREKSKKQLDAIESNMKKTGLCVDNVGDRIKWKFKSGQPTLNIQEEIKGK